MREDRERALAPAQRHAPTDVAGEGANWERTLPSNLRTQPSNPVAQATVDKFKVYMKTVNTLDWDAVNAQRPAVQHPLEQDGRALTQRSVRPRGLWLKSMAFRPKSTVNHPLALHPP